MKIVCVLIALCVSSCTGYKLDNINNRGYAVTVNPIRAEGGARLQREIASQLLQAGFGYTTDNTKNIVCRVEVCEDSARPITKFEKGKVASAKHSISLKVHFEDDKGSELVHPLVISAGQIIGFLEPDNLTSLCLREKDYFDEEYETYNDFTLRRNSIKEQCLLLDDAKIAASENIYKDLASKILLYLQTSLDERAYNLQEVTS